MVTLNFTLCTGLQGPAQNTSAYFIPVIPIHSSPFQSSSTLSSNHFFPISSWKLKFSSLRPLLIFQGGTHYISCSLLTTDPENFAFLLFSLNRFHFSSLTVLNSVMQFPFIHYPSVFFTWFIIIIFATHIKLIVICQESFTQPM